MYDKNRKSMKEGNDISNQMKKEILEMKHKLDVEQVKKKELKEKEENEIKKRNSEVIEKEEENCKKRENNNIIKTEDEGINKSKVNKEDNNEEITHIINNNINLKNDNKNKNENQIGEQLDNMNKENKEEKEMNSIKSLEKEVDNRITSEVTEENIKIEPNERDNDIKGKNNDCKYIINGVKYDFNSENSESIKYDCNSPKRAQSNKQNIHIRQSQEIDLDKIVGKYDCNETIDNKLYEKIQDEEEDMLEKSLNGSLNLSTIYREALNRKWSRKSLFLRSIDSGQQKANFGEIINAQLNEIKNNTLSYFDKTIKEFEQRYNDYINHMNNYINENELKISQVFQKELKPSENDEDILEYADNNIFKQFDDVLELHGNIFNAIEDHVGLLRIFLGFSELIQKKNPLEYFLNNNSNDIFNCWFLNKINFQKLNLSKVILNKDLSELCSRYLCKKKENNYSAISIKKDMKGNISLESDFVRENLNNLENLKFTDIRSEEINLIFKSKNGINQEFLPANKLRSLSIVKSDFSTSSITKLSTPCLQKLKFKRTPLYLALRNFLDAIIGKTLFLQKLCLQKCYLDNYSLSQIFWFLSEKESLVESLQTISFSGNDITMVDMKQIIDKNLSFKSLQYLDLSKNNIYEFMTENFKILQEIKVLDLSCNNISNYNFLKAINSQKKKQSITLLCNNIFLNNVQNNIKRYYQYLYEHLTEFKYKVKSLNFSYFFNKNTMHHLLKIKISPMIKISLIKLNLSNCGLNDNVVCNFLKNNFGLLNLKILNLSNNYITLKIFSLLLQLEIMLEKLNTLDLSMNFIESMNIDEYESIKNIVDKYKHLRKIKVQETSFAIEMLLLTQTEKERSEKVIETLIKQNIKFVVEKENSVLITPLKELFEIKDKEF